MSKAASDVVGDCEVKLECACDGCSMRLIVWAATWADARSTPEELGWFETSIGWRCPVCAPAVVPDECDGYNHPLHLVKAFQGGEYACVGCGVSLV